MQNWSAAPILQKDKIVITSNSAYDSLKIKDFIRFLLARFCFTLAVQIQSVVVMYQVYKITHDEFSLGLVGLAEAIPFIALALFAGHIIDKNNRKRVILFSLLILLISSALLFYFSINTSTVIQKYGTTPIYICIAIVGVARSFLGPGFFSFLSQLIPRELYANASTWNTTVWHTGAVIGPAVGGLLLFDVSIGYCAAFALVLLSFIFVLLIPKKPTPQSEKTETIFESLSSGIKFVFGNQIVLGALSLDLFAVLFGGAVAMLPAFSETVLHQPETLGWLKAAPAVGAVITSFIMAYKPPSSNAGRSLIISVFAFGVATILFALSTSFISAFIFLLITGAVDNVSVVIRHTILQLMTPENMRGRVSAVNSIFIGSSNEIGAFESGTAAKLMGLIPSIIFGGCMTMFIVGFVAKKAPKLRKLNLKNL